MIYKVVSRRELEETNLNIKISPLNKDTLCIIKAEKYQTCQIPTKVLNSEVICIEKDTHYNSVVVKNSDFCGSIFTELLKETEKRIIDVREFPSGYKHYAINTEQIPNSYSLSSLNEEEDSKIGLILEKIYSSVMPLFINPDSTPNSIQKALFQAFVVTRFNTASPNIEGGTQDTYYSVSPGIFFGYCPSCDSHIDTIDKLFYNFSCTKKNNIYTRCSNCEQRLRWSFNTQGIYCKLS